jgi:hypothetical protein
VQLVFDLDGCVVDNRSATRIAYELAGVTEFPEQWFHRSGWASEEQRRDKAVIYARTLPGLSRLLPAGKLFSQVGGVVLSGCSRTSLETFLRTYPHFCDGRKYMFLCEFTLEDKIKWLSAERPGIYFDDWNEACKQVRERTKWRTVDSSQL